MHACGPSRADFEPDGALHCTHVPKAPLLEVVLEIHEFLTRLVGVPMVAGMIVDVGQHLDQSGVADMRTGDVAF